MITIIIGTNAVSSSTAAIAKVYLDELSQLNIPHQLLDLKDIPVDFIHSEMYYNRSPSFIELQERYLFPTNKYIVIVPEYNGGIPGIFKLMIDASDISQAWWGKKAALCGLSAGRAGNLRGLDNLTNIFHYLKMDVLKNKLPNSRINDYISNGQLNDSDTKRLIQEQIEELLLF